MTTVQVDDTSLSYGPEGIFGTVNEILTSELALRIGQAAGIEYQYASDTDLRVLIGKDTRRGNYMIESALTAGFTAVGMNVDLTGPIPTAAVAVLTHSMRADLGVMITAASGSTFEKCGVKFFNPDGSRISVDTVEKIRQRLDVDFSSLRVHGRNIGRAKRIDAAQPRYIEFVKGRMPGGLQLDGTRVVVDCANGAAYEVAPHALRELGAEVVAINVEPDGFNINHMSGPAFPAALIHTVHERRADIGIALDGDGGQVMLVDEKKRRVKTSTIVAIIERFGRRPEGLNLTNSSWVQETDGDKILIPDIVGTSDGLLTALYVLSIIASRRCPFSEIVDMCET